MNSELIILFILLVSLVVFAVCTVLIGDLLKSAIALGITSAILSIIMFIMNSYLAAVFELSVCAGLITAVFISTISLTKPQTDRVKAAISRQNIKHYIFLPLLLLAVGIFMVLVMPHININFALNSAGLEMPAQEILWNDRRADVLGHIIIILAGVFGVVILFKGRDGK